MKRSVGIGMDTRNGVGPEHFRIPMSEPERRALNDWFQIWFKEGERMLADAINADENIIAGKQMLFDSRPRLGDQYREVANGKYEVKI